MAQQTKKQNKALSFLKANLAIVVIVACMLAIIAIVIVETNGKKTDSLPEISVNGGGIEDAVQEIPNPDGDLIVDTQPISFDLPIDEYTIATDYTEGDEFVYSSTLNEWATHRGIDFVP